MNSQLDRPLVLLIVDGLGVSERTEGNAVFQALTPNYDDLRSRYPSTELAAAGPAVGLDVGAPGNAEIGHMNLGAGRVIKTDAARIAESIENGAFFENEVLKTALDKAAAGGRNVHFIGLLSDGEIHSSPETLYALLRMAKQRGVTSAFIHCILDGRDVLPRTADVYVDALQIKMADIGLGKISTLCGRFFAMDSGENWERTARAFTMLVLAEGERSTDAQTAVRASFLRGISDEFIAPIVIEGPAGTPLAPITDGDTVIFFNHRADTMKQLVRSLSIPDPGSGVAMAKPAIEAVCLTEYESSYNLKVAFPAETCGSTLSSVLNEHRIPNHRISDSDRFPHVTKFLNCGKMSSGPYEQHLSLPSINSAARECEPEMSSFKVTDRLLRALDDANGNGVFVACLPAPDLVAETGNYDRTVEAVQYVDTCLGGIVDKIREIDGIAVITSSHGNCEEMIDRLTGEPNRSTTKSNVPFHIIDARDETIDLRTDGSLCDVAPTLLALAGIDIPDDMTGRDLRRPINE